MASSRFSTALALSPTVAVLVGLRFDVLARGEGGPHRPAEQPGAG